MKSRNSTLKSFTRLKLITSPDKYFLFLWNNVYEIFGRNYCIPKRWQIGPLQLSLPPLAQTPSYATGSEITLFGSANDVLQYNRKFSKH